MTDFADIHPTETISIKQENMDDDVLFRARKYTEKQGFG